MWAAMLGGTEAEDGACECSDGFNDTWRCQSCSTDLGGLLQRRPETVWVLKATTVLGGHGADLLEVWWCSGSNPGDSERTGARRSCGASPEKKYCSGGARMAH